jgi:hypothetical protein
VNEQGAQGAQGPSGPQGVQGKGEKGRRGERGLRGRTSAIPPAVGWVFLAFGIVLAVVLVGMILVIINNRGLAKDGKEAHDGLCVIRRNLEADVANGDRYIDDVKNGRRRLIEGFTLAEIEERVADDRNSVEALAHLDCSGVPQAILEGE